MGPDSRKEPYSEIHEEPREELSFHTLGGGRYRPIRDTINNLKSLDIFDVLTLAIGTALVGGTLLMFYMVARDNIYSSREMLQHSQRQEIRQPFNSNPSGATDRINQKAIDNYTN